MKKQQLVYGIGFDFEGERFVINSVRHEPLGKVYFANQNDEQEEFNMHLDIFRQKMSSGDISNITYPVTKKGSDCEYNR